MGRHSAAALLLILTLLLRLGMLTDLRALVMTIHGAESSRENGTLLDLLPVVQHVSILKGALHLLASAGNDLGVIRCNDLFECGLAGFGTLDAVEKLTGVANAVVQALPTVWSEK